MRFEKLDVASEMFGGCGCGNSMFGNRNIFCILTIHTSFHFICNFFTVHSSIVKTRCLNAISHGVFHIGRIRRVIISREVWFWYHGGNHFHSENSKFWQCASGVNPKSCRLCVLSFFAIQNAITPWLWGVSVASVTSRFLSAQGQYNKHI